jgi:transposase-like protein
MENRIAKLNRLIKKLPEDRIADVLDVVERIVNEDNGPDVRDCPHCGADAGTHVVRYGKNGAKQRFRCNKCGKYFSRATKSAAEASRHGEAAWKQAIRDTLAGVPLDKTAESLNVTHVTAFNMRHKILSLAESAAMLEPTVLSGVCEVDDTYVLESVKGTKILDDYHRGPRKHGAKASKRGISDEQVSIMAGVSRDGAIFTKTVNRATPSKENILEIFKNHIGQSTLVLCDGAKCFTALSDVAEVSGVKKEVGSFYHINNANGYHSFIKGRQNGAYHGVATKYQNRCNAIYSLAYGSNIEERTDVIYNMLIQQSGNFRRRVNELKTREILDLGQLVNL